MISTSSIGGGPAGAFAAEVSRRSLRDLLNHRHPRPTDPRVDLVVNVVGWLGMVLLISAYALVTTGRILGLTRARLRSVPAD